MAENELKFDEEGRHYFVDSGHVYEAEGYEFISSAYVTKENFEDRLLFVEFKDGYLGDFQSENVANEFDERLREVQGVEEVYWEDREFFHITYKEGQKIPELIKRIDSKVRELSDLVD